MSEALEWQPLWDAMDASPDSWIETTEAMFWNMLECVPPRAQTGRAFLVGEPVRDNEEGKPLYACFWHRGSGRHFAKYLTVNDFREQFL